MKKRVINLPTKMYTFICYWRSRGISIRGAYHLWKMANIPFLLMKGQKPVIQERDIEWARRMT